jgi:GGDEF domain-containing protein
MCDLTNVLATINDLRGEEPTADGVLRRLVERIETELARRDRDAEINAERAATAGAFGEWLA